MLNVDRIADFSKVNHCSNDLKAFLQVNQNLAAEINSSSKNNSNNNNGEDNDVRQRRKSVTKSRKQSARPTSMRSGGKSKISNNGVETGADAGGGGSAAAAAGPASASASASAPTPTPSPAPTAIATATATENIPEEVKPFLKMMKMGVPQAAVAIKMQMAGVDASLLDKYVNTDSGGGEGGGGLPPPPAVAKPAAAPKAAEQPKKSAPPPKSGKGGMSMGLLGDIASRRVD